MDTVASTRLPDETELANESFIFSIAQFFASTRLRLTNRRLLTRKPSLLLGLLPVGSDQTSLPLRNIAGVGTSFRFGVIKVPLGLFLVLAGVLGLASRETFVAGLAMAFVGLLFFSAGMATRIWIENTAGRRVELPIVFWERGRAQALAERVNGAIGALD